MLSTSTQEFTGKGITLRNLWFFFPLSVCFNKKNTKAKMIFCKWVIIRQLQEKNSNNFFWVFEKDLFNDYCDFATAKSSKGEFESSSVVFLFVRSRRVSANTRWRSPSRWVGRRVQTTLLKASSRSGFWSQLVPKWGPKFRLVHNNSLLRIIPPPGSC